MGTLLKHPAGNFCWFELGTSDQSAAKEFYIKLFGWQFKDSPLPPEMGGVYTMFLKDGKEVGACYQLGPQQPGVPPHWMPYVSVKSADETAGKVAGLGGELILPPFDVMDFGRMAAFKDPTGAVLSIWESKAHFGADLVDALDSVCWSELATNDTAKAGEFYTGLFGWSLVKSSDGMPYTEIANGEQRIGGILAMDGPQWQGIPPYWSIYFSVDDCDAVAAKAEALGGKLCMGPSDIPNAGRFAVIQDPQGAVFQIIKLLLPA
jgi:predicted enzyme related to lactoylglutathione lyase